MTPDCIDETCILITSVGLQELFHHVKPTCVLPV